jgi:ABC-type uncharacterized transport system permease subunit
MLLQALVILVMLSYIPSVMSAFASSWSRWGGRPFSIIPIVMHLAVLLLGFFLFDVGGWRSPLLGLAGLSFFIACSYQSIGNIPRMERLNRVMLPLTLVLLLLGLLSPGGGPVGLSLKWWVPLHISLILIGFSSFGVSFAVSSLFLLVRRRLKNKQLKNISTYPSLEILDLVNYRSTLLGFLSLTAGTAAGLAWLISEDPSGLKMDFTGGFTICLWAWYAVGLHTRMTMGRRNRWAAWFAVIGFLGFSSLIIVTALLSGQWHIGGGQ